MLSNEAVRAFAWEASAGARNPLGTAALIWTFSESRADTRRLLNTYERHYADFIHHDIRMEARSLLEKVREETR